MKACLAAGGGLDVESAIRMAAQWPGLDGQDYASKVSCQEDYRWDQTGKFTCTWGVAENCRPPISRSSRMTSASSGTSCGACG